MTDFYNKNIYEKIFQFSPDLICVIDSNGYIVQVNQSCIGFLGYNESELVGKPYIEFVLPEDREQTLHFAHQIMSDHSTFELENRYMHKSGKIIDLMWSAAWSEEDKLMFWVARVVKEMHTQEAQIINQRYIELFNKNPEGIFCESLDGIVTDANEAFSQIFFSHKKDFIGVSASAFMTPEMASVNQRSLEQVLLGSIMRYDIELIVEGKGHMVFDTIKQPVIINNKLIGAQTILKDITPIVRSQELVKQQVKKLNNVFESITDAFFTVDIEWRFTYINNEAERLLSLDRKIHIGESLWALFPNEVGGKFYVQYYLAVDTGKSTHFEAYYAGANIWIEVKAFPSETGLSVYFSDITKRVKAQEELEKLSLVASKTNNSVIIADKDWRIEWVNDGFTKLMGYSMQEAVGKKPSELLHNHKTDRAVYEQSEPRLLNGEQISFDVLYIKKDGSDVWVNVEITAIFGEDGQLKRFVEVHTDITALKTSEIELKKLSLVASNTDNGVIITDTNGLTEWVNDGFTRITGYTLNEMQGKKPGTLLQGAETDKETVNQLSRNLRKNISFHTELINYKKSGEKFWVSMDISPIHDDGKVTQYIAIQRNITSKKKSEANLLMLADDLFTYNRDLKEFTYIVSHNLRAPVATALGLVVLLKKMDKSSKMFDVSISHLKKSIVQMDTVLKDVNMVLSIRDREGIYDKEEIELQDVINQAVSHLEESLVRFGVEIITDIQDGVTVNASRAYLFSVFYNLLTNAIKFRSKERNPVVRIQSFDSLSDFTTISISDNGIGFDFEKVKDNVFGLYKRFHNDISGRGIGLFLVKTHVDAMEGQVKVSSQVGVGTTFKIQLPKF